MKKHLVAGLAAAGLSGGLAVAFASSDAEFIPPKQPILVMDQAVPLAKHYGRGKVIKVELERQGERRLYEAKVTDTRGDVRALTIDARTAELLETRLVSR